MSEIVMCLDEKFRKIQETVDKMKSGDIKAYVTYDSIDAFIAGIQK